MKLTFKDLKQQKFVIEAEPSETIANVKNKIASEKGWESSQQKLIYSGKILQDGNTVESYNIEEKGFIVCMVSKPKPAPAAAPSAAEPSTPAQTSSTPSAPAAPAAPPSTANTNAPATPSPAPSGTAGAPGFNDPSALAMGGARDAAIADMESMGFDRADIDRAMRAAYSNPDRAVEYLLNGIPENIAQEQQQAQGGNRGNPSAPTPASPPAATGDAPAQNTEAATGDEPVNLFEAAAQANRQGGQGGGGARGGTGGGLGAGLGGAGEGTGADLEDLASLRNHPQFQQLRQVVQQQPQMLAPILQSLAQGNPRLSEMIQNNPGQFLSLLAEGGGDDDTPMPPGAQTVSVTEEERDAIERLCRLGFERDLVIQAYFACDRNEELAANFLFDQPEDPEEQ
ncbi:MAG: hypothetical protein M1821_003234 [Bathelium mastoideum]|nr:MAG: hypothetical protein M1821_003234 [Bathelium mastoideum]KAI9689412.1 MAG: hypothetical protein M1822_010063 [Bathelium mastoideum]